MNCLFFWSKDLSFPPTDSVNPYGPLFARAMAQHGIHLHPGPYALTRDWLEAKRSDFDLLHVNGLHPVYLAADLETALERATGLVDALRFARAIGYRIVWTLHNLYPHERPYPDIDHMVQMAAFDIVHHVVAHCAYGAERALALFHPAKRPHVIPHGNYIDAYPNTVTRQEARARLGLADNAFVYLYFGAARPYKGIERLIETFRSIAGSEDHLLIAGSTWLVPEYGVSIQASISQEDRITAVLPGFIPSKDCQLYFNAADVVVLPYADVLTSGTVLMAFTFSRPVVVPALGCLPEYVDASTGLLFDQTEDDGLAEALTQARTLDLKPMERAARTQAERLNWESIAEQFAALYREG